MTDCDLTSDSAVEGQDYGYDELGNPDGISDNGFGYVATATYDALGQIDQ